MTKEYRISNAEFPARGFGTAGAPGIAFACVGNPEPARQLHSRGKDFIDQGRQRADFKQSARDWVHGPTQ